MNPTFEEQSTNATQPKPRPSVNAWLKLLGFFRQSEAIASELAEVSKIRDFRLGDELYEYYVSDSRCHSAQSEHNLCLYIVDTGRVRLLSGEVDQQEVSVQVLQEAESFGADQLFSAEPLSYRAVAASSGRVVAISIAHLQSWLEQPQLRSRLLEHIGLRQRLIFFKTLTELKTYPSQHIQSILPCLEEVKIAAGATLETAPSHLFHFWLRQGEVKFDQPSQALTPGCSWDADDAIVKLVAPTDLVLYGLPLEQWESLATTKKPATNATNQPVEASSQRASRKPPSIPPPPGAELLVAPTPTRSPGAHTTQNSANPLHLEAFPQPRRQRPKVFGQGYPFIEQQSSADCGVACLAMVGQFWGKRLNLNVLRNLADVARSGTSLKKLANAAESIGFIARPVRASLQPLLDQANPWIAHWQGDHYVVVYQVRGSAANLRLLVADPARGKRTLSREEFLANWTGYALLLNPTEQLQQVEGNGQPSLWQFGRLLLPYRSVLWQVILTSVLYQIFGLITPLFTQVILDQVVVQKSLSMLHIFALGLVLFSIWRVGVMGVRQYLLDYLSNRLDLTLLSGFVSHTLRLPLKFFESRHVGDIITRIQENEKVQRFLVRQAVATWLDALSAVVYLMLMFYYNWKLALLVVGLIPPIVALTLAATPLMKRISREIFSETAEQNSIVVEMITGIATVKSVAAEQELRWRWEDRLTAMLNVRFKGQKLANGLHITSGLINALGSAALLWYGATLVIQDQLTIGQFVAFNMLVGSVIGPVLAVVGIWDELQEVLISVERLNDVFSTSPEENPTQPMLILPELAGSVRFENVTFSYDTATERNILQNLAFTIPVGETVAIVGRSGSGKTTLVKLLQGLYHPNRGRILIDGHDIRHVSPASLRSQLGVVPQETFLFSGTILENIQLFRSEFNLDQVIEAAKLAEAHGFIQELPLGYNTKVGERGTNLSGGQRQRIAIARALLGNPAILILDEATSALDTESERRFQQNLTRISHNRTTLIIAHRLSTVQTSDRILVLDRGILVEQGTHEALVATQGLYYHLAQQQLNL